MDRCPVLAVAGAKGGVGKTTTCVNVGAALTDAGADVAIVEADLAMADRSACLPVDDGADLHDALHGDATLAEVACETDAGTIYPGGGDLTGYTESMVDDLPDAVADIGERHDLILLDTAVGLRYRAVLPLALADTTVLVSTPRAAAVRAVAETAELVDRVDGSVAGIVLTRTGTGSAPPPDRIASFVGVDSLGAVPADAAVPLAQDRRTPVVVDAPDSESAAAYRSVARAVATALESLDWSDIDTAVERTRAVLAHHRDLGFETDSDSGPGFDFLGDEDLVADGTGHVDDAGQERRDATERSPRRESGAAAGPTERVDD